MNNTTKKQTINQEQELTELKQLLKEYSELKQKRTAVNAYFNKLALIDVIQKVNEHCLKLFESMNKNGFIEIYEHDFWKLYLKKFYALNRVFINKDDQGLFVYYEPNTDALIKCFNFKAYALKVLGEQKAKKEQEKRALTDVKIKDFKILSYNEQELKAIIEQCKKQLKLIVKNK